MHYIRQLFSGKAEDWVHLLFTRYGRGQFDGPACEVEVGKVIKFKGTVEYVSSFGWLAASGGGDFKVDGGIFAKSDFRPVLEGLGVDFDDKSKPKQGFYVAQLMGELPSGVLVELYEKMPYATILLSLAGSSAKVKCKKKPPKPGGEKELGFCSGSLDVSVVGKLREEVFFDVGEFKKAKVENRFIIDELVILAGMSAADARLHAKRKGKVERKVTVDGVEKKSSCSLLI